MRAGTRSVILFRNEDERRVICMFFPGAGVGSTAAFVLVLFILLVIILRTLVI
jgi:hypothetical protein